jgi:hypothetical protein
MLSLFMSIAGGVSWEEVVRPLKATGNMRRGDHGNIME